jgi:SAM-dependent methyltransferase
MAGLPCEFLFFPGRHHLLTRFQAEYLRQALTEPPPDTEPGRPDCRGARLVFAVTSADHGNTRRNPVPGHRREAQLERFAAYAGHDCLVFPIADVAPTDRFAQHLIAAVAAQDGGPQITPDNAAVACSSPSLTAQFHRLGFSVLPIERQADGSMAAQHPWDLLEQVAVDGDLDRVADRIHPVSLELFRRYDLAEQIRRVHADALLSDDGELTETRDYNAYARSFDAGAERKWSLVRPSVRPGRIVDIGCGAGSLLREIAADPTFAESDLYGIEAARPLYEECVHRRALGAFDNPNTFFFQRNIAQAALFAPSSIDSTLTISLCHELYSYGGEQAVTELAKTIRKHTVAEGVWVNLDVCGPQDGAQPVWLELHQPPVDELPEPVNLAGENPETIREQLTGMTPLHSWIQFVHDWIPSRVDFHVHQAGDRTFVQTQLGWAMEWLSKKDYTDNWLSEMHETFCFWSFSEWRQRVQAEGFAVAEQSRGIVNEWLVAERFAPVATLRPPTRPDAVLPWPHTHALLVCRRML